MNNTTPHVLIVDDMAMNRLVLSSLLASHGVISDQAESGMECIRLCESTDYDLILLDHRMPDMDGVDTLVRLKEIFKGRGVDIPVVCHTTQEGRSNINLYKAAGFADVLIKPIEPNEFFNVIMTYLKGIDSSAANADSPRKAGHSPEDAAALGTEIGKLPRWLKLIPQIDLATGITRCGQADDYMDALYIFYASIDEKSEEIQSYFEGGDLTMYALKVHSLKSMARLVGALRLGDLAAALEKAARDNNIDIVKRDTKELINIYRDYLTLLSPFEDDEAAEMLQSVAPSDTESTPVREKRDLSRSVLFVQSGKDTMIKGIENVLSGAGFNPIPIADEPEQIVAHREDADIIVYYTGLSDSAHTNITMNLLGEICRDDAKILCLIGEMPDLSAALHMNGSYRVSKTYVRPVDMNEFVKDMERFAALEQDYHRRKTVYIVDDDTSYLPIISRWLSSEYNVSAFQGGTDALKGLSATAPDLMLVDYEMPDITGFELMMIIRERFPDKAIPIIFLTGKNDKEHVFKVLADRPDGYILKTSQKEAILDTIRRFFAETVFRASRGNT